MNIQVSPQSAPKVQERRPPLTAPQADTSVRETWAKSPPVDEAQFLWKGTLKGALTFGLPSVLGITVHPLAGLGAAAVPFGHAAFVQEDQGATARAAIGALGTGLSYLPKTWALAAAGSLTVLGAVVGRVLAGDDLAMRQAGS